MSVYPPPQPGYGTPPPDYRPPPRNAAATPTASSRPCCSSSYGIGSAQGSTTVAAMQGHISLTDGRSGSLTIYLRPETSDGLTWCITSQSTLS
jgi:hypothetical protein